MICKALLWLLVLSLCVGCASDSYVRSEPGELVESKYDLKQEVQPETYEAVFKILDQSKGSLSLELTRVKNIKQTWNNKYKETEVYERRCKGWRGEVSMSDGNRRSEYCEFDSLSFSLSHILLIGFLYDLKIPFQDYGPPITLEKHSEKTIVKSDSTEIIERVPVLSKNLTLEINNEKLVGEITQDQWVFSVKKALLSSTNILKVVLKFDSESLDLTSEYLKFLRHDQEQKEIQALDKRQSAIGMSCLAGDWSACNAIENKKVESTDLAVWLLEPEGKYQGPLSKDTLYATQAFVVRQKVPGGYLFTPNNYIFRSGNFGFAFLKTTKRLIPKQSYCAWFFYIGDFEYDALDGFSKTIPAFRLFEGPVSSGISCFGAPLFK